MTGRGGVEFVTVGRPITGVHPRYTAWAAIEAPNRAAIVAKHPNGYLTCTVPCGRTRTWKAYEIPAASVPCDCGTLDYPHWFIRYRDGA